MIYLFESLEADVHALLPIHVGYVEHPTRRSKNVTPSLFTASQSFRARLSRTPSFEYSIQVEFPHE
jgi:hypothetical protein